MPFTISPSSGLQGVITVPGDKSISHRAVILAALAAGDSTLTNWLPAGDCYATVNAMQSMGVPIAISNLTESSADLSIQGVGLNGLRAPENAIDCQGSGTTMRLLAGVLAGQSFDAVLDGHEGLRRRPMARVATPLLKMGAKIETTEGRPPLNIHGKALSGITFKMPIASGQVKSAILLAALYADGKTTVIQPGPARDHTELMMQSMGIPLEVDGNNITLQPDGNPLPPLNITIPGDFSSAAFPLVAALLVPNSALRVNAVNINDTRIGLLDVLQKMGADISFVNQRNMAGEPMADIEVKTSALKGVEIGGDVVVRMIDEFPILALAATQAKGRTVVRDAAELRVKETDRIKATVDELRKMGAQIIARPDGFEVYGPTLLHAATVDSDGDHRLAMALAVAGLIAEGKSTVRRARVIADSYPGFLTMLKSLGVEVTQK